MSMPLAPRPSIAAKPLPRKALAIGVVVAVVGGCAGPLPPASPTHDVQLTQARTMRLPEFSGLDRQVEAAQVVTARYGDQTYVFEGRLSITPERFSMVAMDAAGRRALTIRWTRDGITYEPASWLPSVIRPENMLADFILLYWPEPMVARTIGSAGGVLAIAPGTRTLLIDGREIARVDYPPSTGDDPLSGRVQYRNLAWGYSLVIESRILPP